MIESKRRTLARIIAWRILATAITAVFTGINTAIAIHIVLMICHYFYERIWLKIRWE
jgi:hypothetical protein